MWGKHKTNAVKSTFSFCEDPVFNCSVFCYYIIAENCDLVNVSQQCLPMPHFVPYLLKVSKVAIGQHHLFFLQIVKKLSLGIDFYEFQ